MKRPPRSQPSAPKSSSEETLKAKVSTWESFFSLFSSTTSDLSLYIPTDKPTRVNDPISILLFTPDSKSILLDCQVVHIFYDSSGKQMGVGTRLGQLSSDQRVAFEALVKKAAKHAHLPVQVPTIEEPPPEMPTRTKKESEGIPIFVEEEPAPPITRVGRKTTSENLPVGEYEEEEEGLVIPPVIDDLDDLRIPEPGVGIDDLKLPSIDDEDATEQYNMSSFDEDLGKEIGSRLEQEPVSLSDSIDPLPALPKKAPAPEPVGPAEDILMDFQPSQPDPSPEDLIPDETGQIAAFAPVSAPSKPSPPPPSTFTPPDHVFSPPTPESVFTPPMPESVFTPPEPESVFTPPEPLSPVPVPAPPLPPSPPRKPEQTPPPAMRPSRPSPHRPPEMPIVGIDFGTTRSSVAVVKNKIVTVLQSASGLWDIPSVVGFTETGEAIVGTEARELLIIDPAHAIASPKRLLGRTYNERDIQSFLAGLAMAHSAAENERILLHPRGKTYTVPQVCAPVLYTLRLMAQDFLQQDVRHVVLTTPVSFDRHRRNTLEEAANLAGLQVIDMVDEPVAAAMAHHFDKDYHDLVAVFDFGGGTFDFSLVNVNQEKLQVVATAGDSWLGGDDFDLVLAEAAANAFWRQHNTEIRHQVERWQRLLVAAEKAKRELSYKDETILGLPDAALTAHGPLNLRFPITRPQFAYQASDLIERALDTCRAVMDHVEIPPTAVNAIFLVGGTSCIPAIREAVAKFFGKPPKTAIPPERAVVTGAALFAAQAWAGGMVAQDSLD